jgi:hypothetical protein
MTIPGMERLLATAPTWCLGATEDGRLMTGPLRNFSTSPDQTVTVVGPTDIPPGTPTGRRHVRENAQQFDVVDHDFPGYRGLYHEGGGNWILWTDDLHQIFVSRGEEEWARTWVYARFLLRHCIVARLLARSGYHVLHAVAGPLAGADDAGLLIAGPYRAGKTFLLRTLIAHGMITEEIEDDCAVIDAEWRLHALLPDENEVRIERRIAVRAMICLDRHANRIEPIAPEDAARWAAAIQTSWPLNWIPGAPERSGAPITAPADLRCLRMPERPAIDDALASLSRL